MSEQRKFIISEIVKYSQRLDQKGFGANHDGNISAKFEGTLLATPTAVSKGNITADDMIIALDPDGKKIEGKGNPFSEIKLHIAAYNTRQDVSAVVHAHPPFATACGLVGHTIRPALPEAIVSLGDVIPTVPFAMPGAKENNDIIASVLSEVNVFMMPGNGVLAVGDCVEQAYLRLELVEHLAKIDYYASHMGVPMMLTDEEISPLLEKRKAAGLSPKDIVNTPKKESFGQNSTTKEQHLSAEFRQIILEEIKKVLQ